MKLTNIGLYSNNAEVANLSFRDPGSRNPYVVNKITGLDAEEIVPKFYGLSIDAAKKYYALSMNSRTIVVPITLNPLFSTGKSYSELRDDLYRAIASSRTGMVTLKFNDGVTTVATLSGFVTKFESQLFEKSPAVQITIKCDDGVPKAPNPVTVSTGALGSSFIITDSISTAPHGFSFQLTFTADSLSFVLQDAVSPEWAFTITPGVMAGNTGFKSGDQLFFSSEQDAKTLYFIRSAVKYYVADRIQPGSIWPVMFPNANPFVVVTGTFTWNAMSYYPTFWGV